MSGEQYLKLACTICKVSHARNRSGLFECFVVVCVFSHYYLLLYCVWEETFLPWMGKGCVFCVQVTVVWWTGTERERAGKEGSKQPSISAVSQLCATYFQTRSRNCEKRLLASSCVDLSVRTEQLRSHWTDFMKFGIWKFFENLSRIFTFRYNLTGITALYMNSHVHLWSYLAQFFL